MLELSGQELRFYHPDLEPWALLRVFLVRTVQRPENSPARLLTSENGRLPIRHVDDFAEKLPESWRERGGVFVPLYPGESLWIGLMPDSDGGNPCPYPFAVKAGTGKVNMLTLALWTETLQEGDQDYAVCPPQHWIPGLLGQDRTLRQMVATPLHSGRTAEEALLGAARHGGIQLAAFPMKHSVYRSLCQGTSPGGRGRISEGLAAFGPDLGMEWGPPVQADILPDPHGPSSWDMERMNRVFIHLADARTWKGITGEDPPGPLAGPGRKGE
ncbi:MAG: hypothetical protein KKA60_02365 [Proteobacteria bacterium]|nr:hypothetical protein [Pseudomonadota bacterium]